MPRVERREYAREASFKDDANHRTGEFYSTRPGKRSAPGMRPHPGSESHNNRNILIYLSNTMRKNSMCPQMCPRTASLIA